VCARSLLVLLLLVLLLLLLLPAAACAVHVCTQISNGRAPGANSGCCEQVAIAAAVEQLQVLQQSRAAMLALFETPAGYALFKVSSKLLQPSLAWP
jgi:NOP5NT (NUC127) domain